MSISDEINNASVEKLANSLVLGTNAARLVGSSPTMPTNRRGMKMIDALDYYRSSVYLFSKYTLVASLVALMTNVAQVERGRWH